jgi:hypothetical protein
VTIRSVPYDYFALYADEAHIRTIADTLRFLSEESASSPYEGLAYRF